MEGVSHVRPVPQPGDDQDGWHAPVLLFPKPPTHTNQRDRPPTYADPALVTRYEGTGSNGSAKLLPGKVHAAAHAMMSALRRVGDRINDWSMKSAVIQSGFRPDDASQGANYLRIIKLTIREKPDIFGELEVSQHPGDGSSIGARPARRLATRRLSPAPGGRLRDGMRRSCPGCSTSSTTSTPRGAPIRMRRAWCSTSTSRSSSPGGAHPGRQSGLERRRAAQRGRHVAEPVLDDVRLRLYNTDKEIWHQEFRSPTEGPGSPQAIELLNCCGPALEVVDEALRYSEQAIREALRRII